MTTLNDEVSFASLKRQSRLLSHSLQQLRRFRAPKQYWSTSVPFFRPCRTTLPSNAFTDNSGLKWPKSDRAIIPNCIFDDFQWHLGRIWGKNRPSDITRQSSATLYSGIPAASTLCESFADADVTALKRLCIFQKAPICIRQQKFFERNNLSLWKH